MNKPAAKEPSMDEILSSIRQIIADEDQTPPRPQPGGEASGAPAQAEAPARPSEPAQPETAPEQPEPEQTPEPEAAVRPEEPEAQNLAGQDAEEEPLALSPEQLVSEQDPAPAETTEDVGWPDFNPDEGYVESTPEPGDLSAALHEAAALRDAPAEEAPAEPEPDPGIVLPDDIAFGDDRPEATTDPEPAAVETESPSAAAPNHARMPDENLSSDMAEKLLEPTTSAATRHAFSRLNSLSIGTEGVTLESMVREMLRPMLKEWLDENLPSVVERMVEREIERISRGG